MQRPHHWIVAAAAAAMAGIAMPVAAGEPRSAPASEAYGFASSATPYPPTAGIRVPADGDHHFGLRRVIGSAPQDSSPGLAALVAAAPVPQNADRNAVLLRNLPDADGRRGAGPAPAAKVLLPFDRLPKPSGWMLLISGLVVALFMARRSHR